MDTSESSVSSNSDETGSISREQELVSPEASCFACGDPPYRTRPIEYLIDGKEVLPLSSLWLRKQ